MRFAGLSIVTALLMLASATGQEPPAPLPLLTKPADTTALRAALHIPLNPPECPLFLAYDGWHELGSRKSEAPARMAEIASHFQGGPFDAERYDEIRAWYSLSGKDNEARECAERAAQLYRQRLAARPGDPNLLARLGSSLFWAEKPTEAEQALRQAVEADSNCWQGWLMLARLNLAGAMKLGNAYQEDEAVEEVAAARRQAMGQAAPRETVVLQAGFRSEKPPATPAAPARS